MEREWIKRSRGERRGEWVRGRENEREEEEDGERGRR
jgi:hypothetical protein